MKQLLLVFIGGGSGSIARFLVGKAYGSWLNGFPFATLTSNFLSCVIFGLFIMLGVEKMNLTYSLKLLLITGFCGGFSTYSAFTFETFDMFKTGQNALAFSNIILNFVLSVSGLYLGMMASKLF
jgi:CrcB protein